MSVPSTPSVPDVTMVTGCFNMQRFHAATRGKKEIEQFVDGLARLEMYLVVYADADSMEVWKRKRETYHFTHLTVFKEVEAEELWSFQFIDKVRENRDAYWPTQDERTCAESHLITCNKFDFVLQTIEENPFGTKRFGWIDAFVFPTPTTSRICEDYTPELFLSTLRQVTEDKFYVQILDVQDKRFKERANKLEYYSTYPWLVCGGMFVTTPGPGRKILARLKEIVESTTMAGYGHGEEAMYLEVLDEFYDDIHRSYGDYPQIVNNFIRPTRNLEIFPKLARKYLAMTYHREGLDCVNTLLGEMGTSGAAGGGEKIPGGIHFQVLFMKYVLAYYIDRQQAREAYDQIVHFVEAAAAFEEQRAYFQEQMVFGKYL